MPDALAKLAMTTAAPAIRNAARPWALALLLACPLLGSAGALSHHPIFSLAALLSLFTALMLSRLLSRRLLPWLLWLVGLAALLLVAWLGLADVLLDTVPILINALLAYWFGRTLWTAPPRVARFIAAIEGPERLAQPGMGTYARQLTAFWTLLLAAQALLLTTLLLFAEHTGLLARWGLASPWPLSDRWAAMWLHVGGYLLLGAAFVLEYGYRRWRLRHLPHPRLHTMLLQLARHWPQLVRGDGTVAS